MTTTTADQFYIIGISTRTTNENGQSATDIPQLWTRFFSENCMEAIPNKIDNAVYCVYTGYELDHTKPYTTILGCKVKKLDSIPDGFTGLQINAGNYTCFTAKGKIADGIVFNEWTKIWNSDIPRVYTADFEVYDERAQNPENAVVDVFIAIQ